MLVGEAAFPPQIQGADYYCAFDALAIDLLGRVLGAGADGPLRPNAGFIVGWVHTHPGLGLFLSPTDIDTLANWNHLDERAVAGRLSTRRDRGACGPERRPPAPAVPRLALGRARLRRCVAPGRPHRAQAAQGLQVVGLTASSPFIRERR